MNPDEVPPGAASADLSSQHSNTVPPKVPDHELLRRIGRGSYGEVWLARNIMGTFRAVKVVYRHRFDEDRPFDRELNGIKKFEPVSRSHEGFVDILQVGRNDAEGYFYSVMELADPRDGSSEVHPESYEPKTIAVTVASRKALTYDECLSFGLATSSALAYLHKRGLVHRDIKPSNLIIVNGLPKLADIGMVTEASTASIAGGSLGYTAPEGIPSLQADVYSLGKVLYELSTGRDRLEHPALPDFWSEAPNLAQLSELNEVVLKACEPNLTKRYASAEELHRELVLLQAGESVKRLRFLERLAAVVRRAALAALVIAVLAGYEFFRVHQQQERDRKQVADIHAAAGARLATKGDLLGALPWYAEALKLDQKWPHRAKRDRMNLETAIRYSPRKVRMFFETSEVLDLAFSPDGQQLAEALGDGRILVRNLGTGGEYVLSGHTNEVRSVSWSVDGKHVVSAGADQTARVWSTENREGMVVLNKPGELYSAAFNPQGDLVVVAGKTETAHGTRSLVRIWRWRDSEVVVERMEHKTRLRTASFSPDNDRIVCAGDHGFVEILESPSLNLRPPSFWHPPKAGADTWVYAARFSPDGNYLATASFDHLARLWDLTTSQPRLFPHDAPVRSVEFSPDQRFLLTACDDYTARIWDIERLTEAFPPLRHNSFLLKASFSADGRLVATATTGGILTVWDLTLPHWEPSTPDFYSPDGSHFAELGTNSVQVFDAQTKLPVATPLLSTGKVRDLKFTQNGRRVLLVSEDSTAPLAASLSAQLYALDGTRLGTRFSLTNFVPEAPSNWIAGISSNGNRVVMVLGPLVQLWDAEHGQILANFVQQTPDGGAAISLDGSRMVTFSTNSVFLINAVSGVSIATLPHLNGVDNAEFSPNSLMLVTACRDDDEKPRAAYVWDARDGKRLGRDLNHQDGVAHATFSSDSRFLLTAGEDRVVQQWRVDSWRLVRRFRHDYAFVSASFNRNDTRVVTAASDDTIRVWDVASEESAGTPLTPPLRHSFNLWHARFIGDGNRVLGKRLVRDRWTRELPRGQQDSRRRERLEHRRPQDWAEWIWLVDGDANENHDLPAMAELLSAQRFEVDEPTALSAGDLEEAWKEVTRSNPRGFDLTPNKVAAWHEQQAERSLQQDDASAALFHVSRLTPLAHDPELRKRVDRLWEILKSRQPNPKGRWQQLLK